MVAQGVEQAIGPEDRINFESLIDIPTNTPLGVYRSLPSLTLKNNCSSSERITTSAQVLFPELVEPGEVEGVDLVVTERD